MSQDPDDYGAVADWDDGEYGVSVDDDGHTTVHGNIDGEHYHRSWNSDGSDDHSTLGKGRDHEGKNWVVNHD